jgi:hypothetical protein
MDKIPLEYLIRISNGKVNREMKTASKEEAHHFIEKFAQQGDIVEIWSRDLNDAFYTNY